MNIQLHKNATTTPRRRVYSQPSPFPISALEVELGASKDTIRCWRKRDTTEDCSHAAHHLQTTLTPSQEIVATALRTTLWLPLDDLPVIVRDLTPIESTFVTARPRTAKARGYMNRDSMLAMVFKLSLSAQKRSANQGEFKLLAMSCKASIFETVLE